MRYKILIVAVALASLLVVLGIGPLVLAGASGPVYLDPTTGQVRPSQIPPTTVAYPKGTVTQWATVTNTVPATAIATTTSTADSIPMSKADGKIDNDWINTGTGTDQIVTGSDPRLTDGRTSTDTVYTMEPVRVSIGTSTTVGTSAAVASSPKFSINTGTATNQVIMGNDARLSDDRVARSLRNTSGVVEVYGAAAPSAGQVLRATTTNAATWQTLGPSDVGALPSTNVNVSPNYLAKGGASAGTLIDSPAYSDGNSIGIDGNKVSGAGIVITNPGTTKYRIGTLDSSILNWSGQFINMRLTGGAWYADDESLPGAFFKLDLRQTVFGNEIAFYRQAIGANPRSDASVLAMLQMKLDTGDIWIAPSGGSVGVGYGTASPPLKFAAKGSFGMPATSGTSQTGVARIAQAFGNGVVDFGFGGVAAGWVQATNAGDLSQKYNLSLNPNGGPVTIGRSDGDSNGATNLLQVGSTGQFYVGSNGEITGKSLGINGSTSGTVTHGVAATTASYTMLAPSTAPGANQAIQYPSGGGQGTWFTPLASTGINYSGCTTTSSTGGLVTACDTTARVAANAAITASGATYKIVQYDTKGLVTVGTNATPANIGAAASTVDMIAGAGLTGGGTLSANRTFNVGASPDGSISVSADYIGVGVINDTQHGQRGGGNIHLAATTSYNGFMSAADKTKLDNATATPTASRIVISDASGTLNSWVTGKTMLSSTTYIDGNLTTNPTGAWQLLTSHTFTTTGTQFRVHVEGIYGDGYPNARVCALAIWANTGSTATTTKGTGGFDRFGTAGSESYNNVLSGMYFLGTVRTNVSFTLAAGTVTIGVAGYSPSGGGYNCYIPSNLLTTIVDIYK